MSRRCLFCDKQADSKEHVWPDWILERLRSDRKMGMAGFVGNENRFWAGAKPELKVKSVCKGCNHGWMHDLECACIPLLGSLMWDISLPLQVDQQSLIAKWAVKTAMVMEAVTRKHRLPFYQFSEREALRASNSLPPNTHVWIGRYVGRYTVVIKGVDVWDDKPTQPNTIHGYISTIAFGYVALQVMNLHVPTSAGSFTINPRPGPWDKLLIQAWSNHRQVSWPPALSFSDTGEFGLGDLTDRWSFGPSPF